MSRVAIFSLTRDRLEYTKTCFSILQEKAGYEYDHYIVDNGSQDGTFEWLHQNLGNFKQVTFNSQNVGLCRGNNQALQMIRNSGIHYDLIVKADNDAEMISDNIVAEMVNLYRHLDEPALLSPRVTGINSQPTRQRTITKAHHPIGVTGHIGGLFAWCNADLYLQYTYPDDLPLARGDDSAFAYWVYQKRYCVGYVEDLVVNHIEGTNSQQSRYPDYFLRKWREEEEIPKKEESI